MDNPNAPDLALLLDRVKHVGKLLEHQLWQAALDLSLDKSSRPGRRFAGLVEAGAMLDATLLLVMLSEPRRSVTDIRKAGDAWACSIQVTGQARRPGPGNSRRNMWICLRRCWRPCCLRTWQSPSKHS